MNVWLGDTEPDFLWPEHSLIVETDGRDAHGTRAAVDRDRAKDLKLRGAGYRVWRYSGAQLRYDEAIADELVALLSRPRASSYPPRRSRISPASAR